MSSSTPGGTASKMSAKSERPRPCAEAAPPSSDETPPTSRLNSATASSTLTSHAYSDAPATPSTRTTSPDERSVSSASPRECAGSVETSSVEWPSVANCTASEAEVVVLPTPPLPPTRTNRSFWSASKSSHASAFVPRKACEATYCSGKTPRISRSKKGSRESASSPSGEEPSSRLSSRPCSARMRSKYAVEEAPSTTWLTIKCETGTPWSARADSSRAHSATARRDGMPTTTKSVTSSSVSSSRSEATRSRQRWRRATAASILSVGSLPPSTPLSKPMAARRRALSATTLPRRLSRNSGKASNRSVWPVGAVSKTTRSKPVSEAAPSLSGSAPRTTASVSARASSSSRPGGTLSRMSANSSRPSWPSTSSASPPSPRSAARKPLTAARKRSTASAVSTSIACRFSHPATPTGEPPDTSCISASERECAGSVETMSVERPVSASRTAMALELDVLPTPPFPPTRMSRCAAPCPVPGSSSEARGVAAGATQRTAAARC
mmetsp:Transcript_17760/g.57209  ORF Transcript_17760/g.57209 Transcript_17760/m.57209 type:complete len:497 (-) Transcript_17760:116-1606(-)